MVCVPKPNDLVGQDGIGLSVLDDHAERVVFTNFRPECIHLVLKAVAVGIAQQVKSPVVAAGEQASIRRILDVVEVAQLDWQLAHGEAGHQHLNARIGGGCGERRRGLLVRHRGDEWFDGPKATCREQQQQRRTAWEVESQGFSVLCGRSSATVIKPMNISSQLWSPNLMTLAGSGLLGFLAELSWAPVQSTQVPAGTCLGSVSR